MTENFGKTCCRILRIELSPILGVAATPASGVEIASANQKVTVLLPDLIMERESRSSPTQMGEMSVSPNPSLPRNSSPPTLTIVWTLTVGMRQTRKVAL